MKRFTETMKWTDPWFRRLSGEAKMLWLYCLDHCDLIGIVELDLELVASDCRLKVTVKNIAELGGRIQAIGGSKFFIPKFIGFQYGRLSEACRPHEKVIEAIRSHRLESTPVGYLYPTDRVSSGVSVTPMDKEEDKNKTGTRQNKTRATREEISEFCKSSGLFPRDVEYLWNKWEGNGWTNNKQAIKDWKATVRTWKAQGDILPSQKNPNGDRWPAAVVPEAPELPWEERKAIMAANIAAEEAREAGGLD